MNLKQVCGLLGLGLPDEAIVAMAGQAWPSGIPTEPSQWDNRDVRCLVQYATNCLHSENGQDVTELDALFEDEAYSDQKADHDERRFYNIWGI